MPTALQIGSLQPVRIFEIGIVRPMLRYQVLLSAPLKQHRNWLVFISLLILTALSSRSGQAATEPNSDVLFGDTAAGSGNDVRSLER
jgi:hypothetical protein